jgi:predicted MFS family arabinose efflux permease
MHLEKMNAIEKQASWSLASIMSLRLLGLFMVLPLFSLYAHGLKDATPFLIGAALGVYGLTQGLLQIPFGMLSDHFGRKKIITIGFILFACGSVIAAMADTITGMIIGRALQGAGAVGSTIMAMIADLTRPTQRTKAMAIAGMTIGMSFTFAIMLGPVLATWFSVPGLFWIATAMSALAILLLFTIVPTPEIVSFHQETEPDLSQFSTLFFHPVLLQLYFSIFFLQTIFTATFVVIPISLERMAGLASHQQWYIYLPLMLIAFMLSIPMIIRAERKKQLKNYFILAITTLGIAEFLWWLFAKNLFLSALSLLLFLTAFSLLEAFLPSLISKSAPSSKKGTALGIYSCAQFLGVFAGGTLGGWLYGQWSLNIVYLFCVIIVLIWVTMAMKLKSGDIHYGERR